MTNDEILQAAKDVGLLHPDAKAAPRIVFDFAAIIEKRMIERCVVACNNVEIAKERFAGLLLDDGLQTKLDCVAAIRKLGEQE